VPNSDTAKKLASDMQDKYDVPVLTVNCLELTEDEIKEILINVLYEFPVSSVGIELPTWFKSLDSDDKMRCSVIDSVKENSSNVTSIRSVYKFATDLNVNDNINGTKVSDVDLSNGKVKLKINIDNSYFYYLISQKCGIEINNEEDLLNEIIALSNIQLKYLRIEEALNQVNETGYGIVMPTTDELSLEEPEIMKQGGKYGVRLKAHAPSIHMIKCNTYTEVAPVVGSETQSQDLVMYLLKEFENNPSDIWDTNIFGKSLYSLVNEGLNNKLYRMPEDARNKFRETIERVINEGCSGLICIIL
jgi:stage IV sporulation protein A